MTATTSSASGSARLGASSLAAPIACGACLVAGAAYVAANNPSEGSVFVPCPFRAMTGWWCPGCGLTRATHHLLRGDVVQALRFNAFVIVILLGIAAAWSSWLLRATRPDAKPMRGLPTAASYAAIVVLIAFAVIRNVTGLPLRG